MDWNTFLDNEMQKQYFKNIMEIVANDRKSNNVYPNQDDVFNAFKLTPFKDVKVVWLGQDPYHNPGEAMGLSFSVPSNCKIPPSLRNMYKELKSDLGIDNKTSGDITDWAKQGVLLLNASLTVIENKPMSHAKIGWEIFTDNVIKELNNKKEKVVFVFLGNFAKQKTKLITNRHHVVIEGVHPSPLSASRGFFGSKIFSKINNELEKQISW